jgi:leucyl-tRNA synthetase
MLAPARPTSPRSSWSRRLAARGEEWSSIHKQAWPEVDLAVVAESTREVPVQVNGKVRDRITVAANADAAAIEAARWPRRRSRRSSPVAHPTESSRQAAAAS